MKRSAIESPNHGNKPITTIASAISTTDRETHHGLDAEVLRIVEVSYYNLPPNGERRLRGNTPRGKEDRRAIGPQLYFPLSLFNSLRAIGSPHRLSSGGYRRTVATGVRYSEIKTLLEKDATVIQQNMGSWTPSSAVMSRIPNAS